MQILCTDKKEQSKRNQQHRQSKRPSQLHQRTNAHEGTSRSRFTAFLAGRAKPKWRQVPKRFEGRGIDPRAPRSQAGTRLPLRARYPGQGRSPPCSRDASWQNFGQAVRSLHFTTTCMTCVMFSSPGLGQRSWPSTQRKAAARKLQDPWLLKVSRKDVPVKQKHNPALNRKDHREGTSEVHRPLTGPEPSGALLPP